MANLYPPSANWLPLKLVFCGAVFGGLLVVWIWYSWTPKYTRVGYMPSQPVEFSHELHSGQLGMDCRYCHSFVELGAHSNVPTTQTCTNCHKPGGVAANSPKVATIIQSWDTTLQQVSDEAEPIRWVRVHKLPDYAYFNHSAHVNRGVSCVSCHGQVNEMPVVYHAEPLSMGWCLDCHRNPEDYLRPIEQVTNLDWKPEDEPEGSRFAGMSQRQIGEMLVDEWNVHPPVGCAGCHR